MSQQRRTWDQLWDHFQDNISGHITPQRLRDGFASWAPHVASAPPTVNDDATLGFDLNHTWFDLSGTHPVRYVCVSNTPGEAVWYQVAAEGSLMHIVNHGSDAFFPRPLNAICVYWRGSVPPANRELGDFWLNVPD